MKNIFKNFVKVTSILAFSAIQPQVFSQATRTWVSGVGDDVNPCSRTAPCKTFAGAISKTAAGGEINVLDPGGFGAVTITKAINILAIGMTAGVFVSGTNGIVVAAGVNDVVTLRGLDFNGSGSGLDGVNFTSGKRLIIENCIIYGFTGNAVNANLTADGSSVEIINSTISSCGNGVSLTTTTGTVQGTIKNINVFGVTTNGIFAKANSVTSVNNSTFSQCPIAVNLASNALMSLENTMINNNTTAISTDGTSTVRLSNVNVFDNTTGVTNVTNTSKAVSFGNNKFAGNTTNGNLYVISTQ